MRRQNFCFLFLMALLTLLAGCINYDQNVEISTNGSGKMLMHYSLAQQLTAMMALGSQSNDKKENEMPFKIKEDEVRKDLQAKGVRVDKFETKTEGDQSHFYVSI